MAGTAAPAGVRRPSPCRRVGRRTVRESHSAGSARVPRDPLCQPGRAAGPGGRRGRGGNPAGRVGGSLTLQGAAWVPGGNGPCLGGRGPEALTRAGGPGTGRAGPRPHRAPRRLGTGGDCFSPEATGCPSPAGTRRDVAPGERERGRRAPVPRACSPGSAPVTPGDPRGLGRPAAQPRGGDEGGQSGAPGALPAGSPSSRAMDSPAGGPCPGPGEHAQGPRRKGTRGSEEQAGGAGR